RDQPGQAGFRDLTLRLLDVVLDPPEARPSRIEVEYEIGGAWVAVARLTDGAGVEQRLYVGELELGASCGEATVEVAVLRLDDAKRDMAVSDEDERRACNLDRRERGLVAEDVLPDRVAGRPVVEGDAVRGALGLERFEERARLLVEHVARPAGCDPGFSAELQEIDRPEDAQVVVARETDFRAVRDQRAALVPPRPVSDEVAEAPELVRRLRLDRCEDRLQRVQVRVDVGDDRDAHRQRSTLVPRAWAQSPPPRRGRRAPAPTVPRRRRSPLRRRASAGPPRRRRAARGRAGRASPSRRSRRSPAEGSAAACRRRGGVRRLEARSSPPARPSYPRRGQRRARREPR